jgi:hypothetical protein
VAAPNQRTPTGQRLPVALAAVSAVDSSRPDTRPRFRKQQQTADAAAASSSAATGTPASRAAVSAVGCGACWSALVNRAGSAPSDNNDPDSGHHDPDGRTVDAAADTGSRGTWHCRTSMATAVVMRTLLRQPFRPDGCQPVASVRGWSQRPVRKIRSRPEAQLPRTPPGVRRALCAVVSKATDRRLAEIGEHHRKET